MSVKTRVAPIFLLIAIATGLVLLGGTSSSNAADAAGTSLKADPDDVIFDDVIVGATDTKTVKLLNDGTVSQSVTAMKLRGPHNKDFAVTDDLCTGKAVAAGATCTFGVVFTPTESGTRVAHLRVDTTADCDTFLTLAGSGPNDETPKAFVTRAGSGCVAPEPSPSTSPAPSVSPSPTPAGGVQGFQQSGVNSICPGRSNVRINFHTGVRKRLRLKTAKATVGGRTFSVKRNKNRLGRIRGYYYSVLNFKGLTAPRYKVKVRGKLTNGKSFARNRIFKNCITGA